MRRVAFIVNGTEDSPMGWRARGFAAELGEAYSIRIAYRGTGKIRSIARFLAFLVRARPEITYVFDMSYSGVIAALLGRLVFSTRVFVETGDAIHELARSVGERGPFGLWLTRLLETVSLRGADRIVVRGTLHKELLAARGIGAEVLRDGVETEMFAFVPSERLRRELSIEGLTTIGIVGSSIWSAAHQMCYGWELVETIHLLRDYPVVGVMIGDGSGIVHLEARAAELGIEKRIRFVGRVPYRRLPAYLSVIDVCISTQTNDVVGRVRTTGKLPLYLAAGRQILATRVGEAALLLPDHMLVEYHGIKDLAYPERLAARVKSLLEEPPRIGEAGHEQVALARNLFDYTVLAQTMSALFDAARGREASPLNPP